MPSIFRVRLGPIADVAEYDELIEKMAALEIVDTHLVSESVNVRQLMPLAAQPLYHWRRLLFFSWVG